MLITRRDGKFVTASIPKPTINKKQRLVKKTKTARRMKQTDDKLSYILGGGKKKDVHIEVHVHTCTESRLLIQLIDNYKLVVCVCILIHMCVMYTYLMCLIH